MSDDSRTPRSKRQRLADWLVGEGLHEKTEQLRASVGELGVDPFGYDPEVARYAAVPATWLYRHYFRVIAQGIEHIPDGPLLLVANHSGFLPFDGLMIGAALVLEREPPRMVRAMVEKWIPRLPYVSVMFSRLGQIVGTPNNCRRLLDRNEAILVFPEGARGMAKTFDRRYELERFGHGFMRLALEKGIPVVPVGVVGGEEQSPKLANLASVARVLKMPAFPITLTFPWLGPAGLVPLPARCRIYFGEPLVFRGRGDEEDDFVEKEVQVVRAAIEGLIARGLDERTGIFR